MSAARRHVVVGTAGHIDHGKTSLVKALTGTDTDRLPEEKARGITIDLGFAFLEEPDGLTIEVVDVPGHERFVKNMLAGVGGIDLAMLVIAADEGVMPQTREHLAICSLLHIRTGLVVLTKIDMVEPDWIELVRDDVATLVRGTFLEGAPVVAVSAKTGAGLDELRATLSRLAETVPARGTDQLPRLPIDRVFTIKGFGTVVTGTLAAGVLGMEDRVEVFPRGLQAKVRGLQAHSHAVERAVAGQRTAVNLQGLERAAVERGDVIGHAGTLQPTTLVDVVLEVLDDASRPLKSRDRVRLHAGTSEIMARALLLEGAELAPGKRAFARLRLEAPLVALAGDRFVIRSYSPIVTIGGGTLLDTDPPRLKRPARLAHLEILAAGAPEAVGEEHVRGAGGGRTRDGGGPRLVAARRRGGAPARAHHGRPRAVPPRPAAAWRDVARGAARAGGQRRRARVRARPRRARCRGRCPRGPRQGPAGLARAAPEPCPADGGGPARARVPRGGGGAAQPRGGAGACRPCRRRGARALPAPARVAQAGAREGVAVLPRGGPGGDPGQARRPAARAQGDRAGRHQGPARYLPKVRHPAAGILRRPARHGAGGRAAGVARRLAKGAKVRRRKGASPCLVWGIRNYSLFS